MAGPFPAGPFELALDALPDGILIASLDGTLVFVNRGVEQLFGWSRAELLGRPLQQIVPDAWRDVPRQDRARLAETAHPLEIGPAFEVLTRGHDGRAFRVEITRSLIPTPGGTFLVVSITDIGDRQRRIDRQEAVLAEQRAFERAVAALSSRFLNVDSDRLDAAITEALERVALDFTSDRVSFHELDADGALQPPLAWHAPELEPAPVSLTDRARFPWTLGECLTGRVVAFAARHELPHEIDRRSFEARHSQAALILPLRIGGCVGGVLAAETAVTRAWPPDVRHRLELLATIFAQVLSRRRLETALQRVTGEGRLRGNETRPSSPSRAEPATAHLPGIAGHGIAV